MTAGLVLDRVKLEASRFNGREPDQKRYNIETAPLDSTALRAVVEPDARTLAAGELGEADRARAARARGRPAPLVGERNLHAADRATAGGRRPLAWGRKTIEGEPQDAFALETSLKRGAWTLFGRGEITENNELSKPSMTTMMGTREAFRVGKASLGLARDVDLGGPFGLTVGALASVNVIPDGLRAEYGRQYPLGAMAFLRFRID